MSNPIARNVVPSGPLYNKRINREVGAVGPSCRKAQRLSDKGQSYERKARRIERDATTILSTVVVRTDIVMAGFIH